jgi:Na+-translocating ferredoxin:NAD+ oxidoreductase RnfD subunit
MHTGKFGFMISSYMFYLSIFGTYSEYILVCVLFTNRTLPGCVLIGIFGGWT